MPEAAKLPFQQGARVVNVILGGSASRSGSKRQRKEYVRGVNIVGALAPTPPPKWASMPLTSIGEDAINICFPHNDTLFVTAIAANCTPSPLGQSLCKGHNPQITRYFPSMKPISRNEKSPPESSISFPPMKKPGSTQ